MTWHINSSVAQGLRVALKVFQEYTASPAHDSALLEPNKKGNKKRKFIKKCFPAMLYNSTRLSGRGWVGKYLAHDHDIWTECREVSAS